MSFIVKNTTIHSAFDLICPDSCRGCGELGESLCWCCKNDIILEHESFCPNCKKATSGGFCKECGLPPCFMVGWRDEVVGQLVHDFKYGSARNIGKVLAELFDAVLPQIDGDVFVVPLPTAFKHIRLRGFDHTLLIAKKLARLRKYKVDRLLVREKDTVQVGANREARMVQAPNAYRVEGQIRSDATYLLIDDVWTTGSSMKAAIKKLQHTGASKILVGVLAVNRVAK